MACRRILCVQLRSAWMFVKKRCRWPHGQQYREADIQTYKLKWTPLGSAGPQCGDNIFVPDCIIPREHLVSLICENFRAISSYHDTFFYIVTYSINVTVNNLLVIRFHNTRTILSIFLFCILWNHHFFLFIFKRSSWKLVKKPIFTMRHGTLIADFKKVYLHIYIQLVYVRATGV